ncbi:hypothetical protein H4696_001112 [Amycolatopsis lexingtonensis]|uniref:Uncharacterized protein n=1 Tax=Amycolatopsis lexingtonensis TaxID=218822 RepID=A0ABR9HSV7_9PSEU|nr:hypothetical protein [Amycolatopsis lexingtonensis]MBE1494012.1 hypothetical protein [Amycolatopsis lexingtonensis]
MKKSSSNLVVVTAAGLALGGFLVSAGPVSAVEAPHSGVARIAQQPTSTPTTATTGTTTGTTSTGPTSTGPTKTVTSTPKTTAKPTTPPVPKGGVETGGGGTAPDGPNA